MSRIICALCVVCFLARAEEVVVTLDSNAEDLWVTSVYQYADNPQMTRDGWGVNGPDLRVGGWGDHYVAYLKFDTSDLPAVARSVKVRLYSFDRRDELDAGPYANTGMTVGLVTTEWDEGIGWHTRPTAEIAGAVPAPSPNMWCEVDITNIYNRWQSGEVANNGFILFPVNNGICGQYPHFNVFRSSDYSDPKFRPQVVIEYDAPVVVAQNGSTMKGGKRVSQVASGSWVGSVPGAGWTFEVPVINFTFPIPPWLVVAGPPVLIVLLLGAFAAKVMGDYHRA